MLIWLQPLTNTACIFFSYSESLTGVWELFLQFPQVLEPLFPKVMPRTSTCVPSPWCDHGSEEECSYGINCGNFKPENLARVIYRTMCVDPWAILLMQLVIIWLFIIDATKYNDCKLARPVSSSTEQNLNVTLVFDVFLLRDGRSYLLWKMEIHLCYFSSGPCSQMKKCSLSQSRGNCPFLCLHSISHNDYVHIMVSVFGP